MIAALTRIFGVHNLALAEDVVQDAFCRALEVWRIRGIPENPSAWLMATAKNAALDVLRRQRTARAFAPELGRFLESEWTLAPVVEELFSTGVIKDDLLRMMFSCCHPQLQEAAQVPLILHILCGFSVGEVASAFVSTHAATEKRITRAKKVLARSQAVRHCRAGRFLGAPPSGPPGALLAVQRGLSWCVRRDGSTGGTVPGGNAAYGDAARTPLRFGAGDIRACRADGPRRRAPAGPGRCIG